MPRRKLLRRIMSLIWICLGLYVLAAIAVMLSQRSMIYHPDAAPGRMLRERAKADGFEPWQNAAGQRIGWKRLHQAGPARGRPSSDDKGKGRAGSRGLPRPLDRFDSVVKEQASADPSPGCSSREEPVFRLATSIGLCYTLLSIGR